MENRKIMIEVTEEEYEKIKNGQLEINVDEIKKQGLEEASVTTLILELSHRIPSQQNLVRDAISNTHYIEKTGNYKQNKKGDCYDFEYRLRIYE